MLFVESDYDFACHHVTPINAFKDGGCSIEKAREARERWPERFQVYAGVDPVFPEQALDSLEQQVEELKPVGIKLYPNSYTADGVVGWHMDDPEIAFPIFQRAHDLGLKAVAIHKAIPPTLAPTYLSFRLGKGPRIRLPDDPTATPSHRRGGEPTRS
ncbi:amidohydrolase [Bradyrhizobium sp. 186]|uniref:amidohydrolase family protein n=1 Tax=Bradyrhizobium sp. 186 TaxID=2782654 RepID=UPI002000F342|nr:amidohydrolase family protein [Bradyrhizobium sp. 186]UPK38229.1 amidohydrolase [Bradyrhizobium sp. 186]